MPSALFTKNTICVWVKGVCGSGKIELTHNAEIENHHDKSEIFRLTVCVFVIQLPEQWRHLVYLNEYQEQCVGEHTTHRKEAGQL